MSKFKLLFSEYFEIEESILNNYGALNICVSSDLPLFIDPFLLFASNKDKYKELHGKVVNHLLFLKEIATQQTREDIDINLFKFPEIKQNWLGMAKYGNGGKGLGSKFANSSIKAFNGFYNSFGAETITSQTHIEKLTLLNSGVGKDFISDFSTNLILEFLLDYTQKFAIENLKENQVKEFSIRCRFDNNTRTWQPIKFTLPYFYREINGDFIILTPLDILTVDEATINNGDFYSKFDNITRSLSNSSLKTAINNHFRTLLPKKPTKQNKIDAFIRTVEQFPELIDYYIKLKEDKRHEISSVSLIKLKEIREKLIDALTPLCELLNNNSNFYQIEPNSYEEALKRALFLKEVIEKNDGYRIFYDGIHPIAKEDTIQRIFRLTWYASPYDVNSEVNNGRGPADYKVSFGSGDSTIIEFKLAQSSSIKRNLENQTDIYKEASKSAKDISVILCYNQVEIQKVNKILKELNKTDHENIIVIDASPKISASKAKNN